MKVIKLVLIILAVLLVVITGCTGDQKAVISQDEAIRIASSILPTDIITHATISAELDPALGPNGRWHIVYKDIEVTRGELGWQPGPDVYLGSSNSYKVLVINIDAKDGTIFSRYATNDPNLGGPPPDMPLETN